MAELFEKGKIYTFYFTSDLGGRHITGKLVEFEHPLAKLETEGLLRIINCSSAHFVEAVRRREDEEIAASP